MRRLQIQQKVFLFSALVWGIINVVITPPFQTPDEANHFYRAYQVACGNIYPVTDHNRVGGFIPFSMIYSCNMFGDMCFHPERKIKPEKVREFLRIPLKSEKTEFAFFSNTGVYTPVPYVPQSLAIKIGKLFDASPLILMYAGRLLNLICWIILISLAIMISPAFKWVLVILALMPMSIFQASSLSADAFTNGLAFLLTASLFRLAFDQHKSITGWDIGCIIMVSTLLSLSKIAYFPLVLSFFLIPANKFSSVRAYWRTLLIVFSFTGVAVVAGVFFVRHVFQAIDLTGGIYSSAPGMPQNVNPDLQLAYIKAHGLYYAQTLIHSWWMFKADIVASFIGNLGWLDTPLPISYVAMACAFLVWASLVDSNEQVSVTTKRKKMILLITVIIEIIVMSTFIYMCWSPVGASVLDGLQGRYFIPIAPAAFMLFYNRHIKLKENTKFAGSLVFIVISFLVSTYSLICRYYLGAS